MYLAVLCCLPDLVENLCRERCLVLRQEPTVVLLHDIRGILDSIAGLFIGTGLLEDVGRQNIP